MDLNVTVGVLISELIFLGLCFWREKQPVNLMKPRLISYRLVMLFLLVLMLATLAHIITLVTGHPVMPRRKMGT